MGSACTIMGTAASAVPKHELQQQEECNRKIERELQQEKRKKVLKLLLLGPGDSGKSTTLKQIRIIHDTGFTEEERLQKRYIIYANMISGMIELLAAMQELGLTYQIPNSFDYAEEVKKYHEKQSTGIAEDFNNDVADAIGRLLMDPSIQQVLAKSSELNIEESSKYFLLNLDRIRTKDYIPSLDDILKSRVPTSGVVQFSFDIKNFTFKVFDVGGQKAQRRKWIHCFDDVHSVLFITSLSEYNQRLAEDANVNRMRDSIELFDQICNNEWFCNTAMILFLNKIDLFKEKIKVVNINVALKHYKGKQEYRPALDYITRKFKQVNKNAKRSMYVHETCATDTKQIQVVIDSVIDVVIQQTMQKVGIQ